MAILIIPMYDTMPVFLIRVYRGKSPFDPDRSHLHHVLLDLGCSHRKTMLILCAFTIAFTGVAILLAGILSNTQLFFAMLAIALICLPTNWWKTRLLRKVMKEDPVTMYLNRQRNALELEMEEIKAKAKMKRKRKKVEKEHELV